MDTQPQQLTEDIKNHKSQAEFEEEIPASDNLPIIGKDLGIQNPVMNSEQVLHLQRTIGNQATAQILQRSPQKKSLITNLKMVTPDSQLGSSLSRKPKTVIQRVNKEEEDGQITRSDAMYDVNDEDYDEDLDDSVEDQQITRSDDNVGLEDENEDSKDPDWSPHDLKEDVASKGLKVGRKAYSLKKKISFINKVSDGSETGDIAPTTVLDFFSFAFSEGWALGKLIMAIKKLKSGIKRRKVLQEAAKSGGVIDDTKRQSPYKEPPITKDDTEANNLAEAAWYGYSKVKRLVRMLILKISLKLIKIVSHIITLVTGGTSALVTESLALAASSASALKTLIVSGKGIYKFFKGTRGVNRAKNAGTMFNLAKSGNTDAAALIIKMNPFDGFSDKAKSWIKKKVGVSTIELAKPDSPEAFIEQLNDPNIYTPDMLKELRKNIANKMKST